MQLVLDTNGLIIKKRNNAFWILAKEEKRIISPHRITSIAVMADCLLSSAAIRLAAEHQIPIYFMNATGRADAKLWSAAFGSLATIRRQQVLFALKPEATRWVISLLEIKLEEQIKTLTQLRRRSPSKAGMIDEGIHALKKGFEGFGNLSQVTVSEARSQVMGIEGAMAQAYWKLLSALLPAEYQFTSRSRRPALDPFNASLNYLYGMLYNVVSSACFSAGLDPYLGFLHTDGYKRPSLTFDMIEPFRPWVDRILVDAIIKQQLSTSFFSRKDEGISLNEKGKKFIIPLFNDFMASRSRFRHRQLIHKNHIYRFAGEFAQSLVNNPEEDDPFDLL